MSRYAFGPSPNNLRILARRLRMGRLYSPPIRRASSCAVTWGSRPASQRLPRKNLQKPVSRRSPWWGGFDSWCRSAPREEPASARLSSFLRLRGASSRPGNGLLGLCSVSCTGRGDDALSPAARPPGASPGQVGVRALSRAAGCSSSTWPCGSGALGRACLDTFGVRMSRSSYHRLGKAVGRARRPCDLAPREDRRPREERERRYRWAAGRAGSSGSRTP